jgi:hypothetical protein
VNRNLDVALVFSNSASHSLLVCGCIDITLSFLHPHDGEYRFLHEGQVVFPVVSCSSPLHLFYVAKLSMDIKIKVKFTLERATKAQRGSRGIAVLFP